MRVASLAALILLLIAPALALYRLDPTIDLRWAAGGASALSLLAFILYALDKRRARAGRWRIPEAALHLVAALGGWPGAFVAQRLIRHKNRKRRFLVLFWAIVALYQIAALEILLGWPATSALISHIEGSASG